MGIEEIQSDAQLQEFYRRNGILENARKPILVDDLNSLGLDLEEKGEMRIGRRLRTGTGEYSGFKWEPIPVTMKKAVTEVIDAINAAIMTTPENASLKGKRYIQLDHNSDEPENSFLKIYDHLKYKESGQPWLERIVDALVTKGYIFKLDKQNAYGYFVQA